MITDLEPASLQASITYDNVIWITKGGGLYNYWRKIWEAMGSNHIDDSDSYLSHGRDIVNFVLFSVSKLLSGEWGGLIFLSVECPNTNQTRLIVWNIKGYSIYFSTHVKSAGMFKDDLFNIALSVFE